jgi:transposase
MSTKNTRRRFSPDEKVRILREHLLEHTPVSDLCDKYEIKPSQYYSWQKLFFENGAEAFISKRQTPSKVKDNQIEQLKNQLAHKDEIIAEVAEAFVTLKKHVGERTAI